MNKFKDFFYEKNDIIIAIIILLIAAGLIFWRVDAIMRYPETLAKETHTVTTTEKDAKTAEEKKAAKSDKEEKTAEKATDSLWTKEGTLTKDVDVTIESGSLGEAVDALVKAGLFSSYDEFAQTCESVGTSPDKIKAQSYTFKKGASKGDIATKVTQ